MKPAVFEYVRASSVMDALQALQQWDGATVLAGGQSLVPLMNFRLNRPPVLVDINPLKELSTIEDFGSSIGIGALVRHQQLAESSLVRERVPVLSRAAAHIGHWAVRNRGTVGGSVAHADPAAELPAVILALQGTIVVRSVGHERHLTAEEFFSGYFTTGLAPGEMVAAIQIPIPSGRTGFYEVARRVGDFALAGAVTEQQQGGGSVTWFGLGGRPERFLIDLWPQNEDRCRGLLEELARQIVVPVSEEYKRGIAVTAALAALREGG